MNAKVLNKCKMYMLRWPIIFTIGIYAILQDSRLPNFKQLEKAHIPDACKKLNSFLSKYKLHQCFTEDEFAHWFLPQENIVYSFVVEVFSLSSSLIFSATLQ